MPIHETLGTSDLQQTVCYIWPIITDEDQGPLQGIILIQEVCGRLS